MSDYKFYPAEEKERIYTVSRQLAIPLPLVAAVIIHNNSDYEKRIPKLCQQIWAKYEELKAAA